MTCFRYIWCKSAIASQYYLGLQGLKCFDSSQMSDLPPSFPRAVLGIQSTSLWRLVYQSTSDSTTAMSHKKIQTSSNINKPELKKMEGPQKKASCIYSMSIQLFNSLIWKNDRNIIVTQRRSSDDGETPITPAGVQDKLFIDKKSHGCKTWLNLMEDILRAKQWH